MPRGKSIDWDAAFAEWVSLPRSERHPSEFARRMGVGRTTFFRRMQRERWAEKAAAVDAQVQQKVQASSVRTRAERVEDTIRVATAVRARYAQRLRDDFSYKVTATDVAAITRIEMLVEDRAASTSGPGEIPDEFREKIDRLPVYLVERMLLAAATGATWEEILEVEAILDAEEDAQLLESGSGSREAGKGRA